MARDFEIKRGDVFYIRYDRTVGFEEAVGRPAVVVSSAEGIATSPVVQIVFMTTSPRETGICVPVESLSRRSWVICNQLNTIDKSRLDTKSGTLTYTEMKKVDEKLLEVLGLENCAMRAEGVRVDSETNDEIAELKVELAFHKALYEKTLEKLVDLRLKLDAVVMEPTPKKGESPEPEIDEPIDISPLAEKFKVYDKRLAEKKMPDKEVDEILESAGMKKKSGLVGVPSGKAKVAKGAKPININSASREDFEGIGITAVTARNIVNYRKKHGYFIGLEDLLMVPRFGRGCLNVFGDLLEV